MARQETHGLRRWRRATRDASTEKRQYASEPLALNLIPLELQLLVISHLDVANTARLRQVCRFYRQLVTPDFVAKQFIRDGAQDPELQWFCTACLARPSRARLMLDEARAECPWRSLCFRCFRARGGLRRHEREHGRTVLLVPGGPQASVVAVPCRFCGWLLAPGGPAPAPERPAHRPCRVKIRLVSWAWILLGVLQLVLGFMGAVAAWSNYEEMREIYIPGTLNFALMWVSLIVVGLQKVHIRRWKITIKPWLIPFTLESAMTIIWLPPLIANARDLAPMVETSMDTFPVFSLAVFAANFGFRLFNSIGYALLFFDFDPRDVYLPDLSAAQKLLRAGCTFMIYWAVIP
ncbi:hypothetical protein JX266_012989 [Neoarthrinium moseri]|nr:hypothetical protein JX266_012989 [Neoarthrinium moseri]